MLDAELLINGEELDHYAQAVEDFVAGRIDAERFMAVRLQQGIYGQRQDGVQMVRIKVPGGRLRPWQLIGIAEMLEHYAQEKLATITTRQDIQVHYVPLRDTPAALRHLASYGLTTREACGNTVRNVTCCPLAGICPREHADITPFLEGAVTRFLRHPLTQHLPRKFKISFSGCEADCAQGLIHDLGVVAQYRDGRFGFKVLAGGGLGNKPHEAIVIEPFIEERDLLPCMEAVISLHHRYSDRKKRAKSRIKFLVDRFGPEGFIEKYREEYEHTRAAFAGEHYPTGKWSEATPGEPCGAGAPRRLFAQKQPGFYVFPVSVPLGDLTPHQLRGVAALMEREGLDDVRTTQDQNLMLVGVPEARVSAVRAELATLSLHEPEVGDDIVSCPGTTTCRLGITSSKLAAQLLDGTSADLRIRISGCHNSCGQHHVGDIGLHGEGRRLFGKLVPHYRMHFGGDGRTGGAVGLNGPEIPAVRVETAVKRVQEAYLTTRAAGEAFFDWARVRGEGYFEELLSDLGEVAEADLPVLLRDHGDHKEFKVLQLGGSECAGVAQERVAANFSEAAYERGCLNAFWLQRNYEQALDCAEAILRLTGQSLLSVSGQGQAEAPGEIAERLREPVPDRALDQALDQGLVGRYAELVQGLAQLRAELDEVRLGELKTGLDAWIPDAVAACQRSDRELFLSVPLSAPKTARPPVPGPVAAVDLSGVGCPMHYLKARIELDRLGTGQLLDLQLASGEPAHQVKTSLEQDGHHILGVEERGERTWLRVRKAGPATVRVPREVPYATAP